MNILITGGFGYLGSYCAELFSKEEGINITLLGRNIPKYMEEWSKKFDVIMKDVTDNNLLNEIESGKFQCVIHFAAANENVCRSNTKSAIEVNVFGTRNILEICKQKNIEKFIYVSTFHVYGNCGNVAKITEELTPNPVNDYGITHYFGELYCKQYSEYCGLECTVLRPSNFYTGPLFNETNRWTLVPNNFIRQIIEKGGITINSSGMQKRNFMSINDLYRAINLCIKTQVGKYDVFNIGGDKEYSINEIASITQKVYEKITGKPAMPIIRDSKSCCDEANTYIYDIYKIKSIGYTPDNNMEKEIENTVLRLGEDVNEQ